MTRNSTLEKQKIVVKEFQRLLRSGKDLTTNSMYEDAGKKCFLEWRTSGNMIRKYYRKMVTEEMQAFVKNNSALEFDALNKLFCAQFKVCKREGRYLIGFVR